MTPFTDQSVLQIMTLLPNLTYYRITRGDEFGMQTRTLTPEDTWLRSIWDLHMLYLVRQVLFPKLAMIYRTLHFETTVECTASYFVKIFWRSRSFFTPSPHLRPVYCFICGRRSEAVARNRMICLVLPTSRSYLHFLYSLVTLPMHQLFCILSLLLVKYLLLHYRRMVLQIWLTLNSIVDLFEKGCVILNLWKTLAASAHYFRCLSIIEC